MKFEESKFYIKHRKIIDSFRNTLITEHRFTMLRHKIETFINELEALNLYQYIKLKADFNSLDWLIHDNIMQIYKEYSAMYVRCIEVLYPESFDVHYNRSNRNLNMLIENEGE